MRLFYRQFENTMKYLQNCIHFLHELQEMLSREDVIKVHSLLHHQLCAPVFGDILCYAMLVALQNWQIIGNFLQLYLKYVFHILGCLLSVSKGTRWRISFWHCATSRKVAALIPCDLNFSVALWLWCQFSLQQQWVPRIFCGSKDGRRLGLTTLPL